MPVTLSQIAANTATVKLPVGDDAITIVYYPSFATDETYLLLENLQADDQTTTAETLLTLNGLLLDLIKSWDLYENDGTSVVPLTKERFAGLQIGIKSEILQSIMSDMRPKSAPAPEQS